MTELPLEDPRWLSLVSSHPEASVFHHPAWAQMLAETYGFSGSILAVPGDDGALRAGLPLLRVRGRWISLPYTDACGPLAVDVASHARLLEELTSASEQTRTRSVEVHAPIQAVGFVVGIVGVTHRLELRADPAETMRSFRRSHVRRNIASAQRNGVQVREAASREDISDTFYSLHVATRRRQGSPVQPRRFFDRLWEHVLAQGLGFCLLAELAGRPIAGAVFLEWNRVLSYKFGASDPRFWQVRPNHLLFWRAIERASGTGARVMDLGRSEFGDSGLREFKSSWGAAEQPLVYSSLGGPAPRGRPSRALGALGVAIRHSPPVVCRLLGQALYRYAA